MNVPIFRVMCYCAGIHSPMDASDYLNIREDTANSMWYGKKIPPEGIIVEIVNRYKMRNDCDKVMNKLDAMDIDGLMNMIYSEFNQKN